MPTNSQFRIELNEGTMQFTTNTDKIIYKPFSCEIFVLIAITTLLAFGVCFFKAYIYFTSSRKQRNVQNLVHLIRQKYETKSQKDSPELEELLDLALKQVLQPGHWRYVKAQLNELSDVKKELNIQQV